MEFQSPQATVEDVHTKSKNKWRPVALDTVELEKMASRKLRISAKETMKIAEKLYTQGFISYPRTETNIFPKDLDLQPLIENQTHDPNWGGESMIRSDNISRIVLVNIIDKNLVDKSESHEPINLGLV